MLLVPVVRSTRERQKERPCLQQVFFKLAQASRQARPRSLRVPPLIFRCLTCSRRSPSLPLVCSGPNTRSNSALLRCRGWSAWFKVATDVWEVKISSKRKERALPLRAGLEFVAFAGGIGVPDLPTYCCDLCPLGFMERAEFGKGTRGGHPTQAMRQDIELARILPDDRQSAEEAVAQRPGQSGVFRRTAHRPCLRDAPVRHMGLPGGCLSTAADGMVSPCRYAGASASLR